MMYRIMEEALKHKSLISYSIVAVVIIVIILFFVLDKRVVIKDGPPPLTGQGPNTEIPGESIEKNNSQNGSNEPKEIDDGTTRQSISSGTPGEGMTPTQVAIAVPMPTTTGSGINTDTKLDDVELEPVGESEIEQNLSPIYVTNQFYNRANFDKGIYTGDWLNGQPEGYGTIAFDSDTKYKWNYITNDDTISVHAAKYEGYWSNGKRSGHGVVTYTNGRKEDGNWNKNGFWFDGYEFEDNRKRRVQLVLTSDRQGAYYVKTGEWENVSD